MLLGSISLDRRAPRRVGTVSDQTVVIAIFTLVGLVLRLAAARGDLWLDEIWTFRLLEKVPSFGSVFFALPNDNNHLLNTAWSAIVGPDASPLIVRLPAVVFGTLCVPVAARIGARRNEFLGLLAAAIVSLDGIFVHYGSEARGYSGLILAMLVGLDQVDIFLDNPERRAPLLPLGLAVAFGTLSHLIMMAASVSFGVTAVVRVLMRSGWQRASVGHLLAMACALIAGTTPAILCLAVSLASGPFHTGVQTPFSWSTFAMGMGRMAAATLGLPDRQPLLALAVAAGVSVLGIAFVARERRVFPACALFAFPAVQAILHMPNEQFARFHLLSSVGLLALAIEVLARAATIGAKSRAMTLVILPLALVGQVGNLAHLLLDGRGAFKAPVALMGADGPTTVVIQPNMLFGETSAVVEWYAKKTGVGIKTTTSACAADTKWLLLVREPGEPLDAPDQRLAGSSDCSALFTLQDAYPASGLSGFTWLVFHRKPG